MLATQYRLYQLKCLPVHLLSLLILPQVTFTLAHFPQKISFDFLIFKSVLKLQGGQDMWQIPQLHVSVPVLWKRKHVVEALKCRGDLLLQPALL